MAEPEAAPDLVRPAAPSTLKRVEHYALYMLHSMAAGGPASLADADIDLAIDVAERLARKLVERGHIQPHD